jgi:hypothetical protein
MELVWNSPLLRDLADPLICSQVQACRKLWKDCVLPSLAEICFVDAETLIEVAHAFEKKQIEAVVQCDTVHQLKQQGLSACKHSVYARSLKHECFLSHLQQALMVQRVVRVVPVTMALRMTTTMTASVSTAAATMIS